MKTSYKLILLIVVACLSSIAIFYFTDRANPIAEEVDILVYQQELEQSFYPTKDDTFENPRIIVNPYGNSPLTALIIFQTKDLTAPTVVIHGKDENTTYTKKFTPSKEHILPIYGLYAGTDNIIDLTVNNETKTLTIKTDLLPDDFILPTSVIANKQLLGNDLYFVTPSSSGYTAAYDVNGDVRWYLTDMYLWDIQTLNNGNLLLSTNRLINPPYYTTGLMEMDFLGKVYFEYSLPGGYHHDVFEMENGNFLIASNDFTSGTVEDYIVEMDRDTGEIVKTFDLKKLLNMEDGKNENWSEYDWFHNNAVWYDKATNSITLSGRHQDAIINIDYNSSELNWIVGDPTNWSDEYQKYFFTPIGDNFEWQWSQHASMILPNGDLFVFDNGNNRSKIKEEYIDAVNNYSRGVIYHLDTVNHTISQVWEYGKNRGSDFYSPYISDVDYLGENHYLIHSGGISYQDGIVQNQPAGLTDIDRLNSISVEILNDEVIFEMQLPGNFYRAEKMNFYSDSEFSLGEGKRLGNMGITPTSSSKPILIFSKQIDDHYNRYNISVKKEPDRLVVTGTFQKDDKVQVILDNTFDKRAYDVRISKRPYTAMCIDIFNEEEDANGITVTKYINDFGITGKYYLYIKINNTIYDLNQYILY